jgi:vanillate/3-O-methylgallate O-demethylase
VELIDRAVLLNVGLYDELTRGDDYLYTIPTVPPDPSADRYIRFGPYFEVFEYTDWVDESMSWKDTCYVGDWSPLMKFSVKGPDALRFFSDITINSLTVFEIGQAKHAVFPNSDGKVMGEGILMRISEDELYFTSGPGAVWANYKFFSGSYDAEYTDFTAGRTIQQVQGPTSLAVLEEACGESLRDIGFMRFREVAIDGMKAYLLRQGMAGEVGYELHGVWDDGAAVYDRIWQIGQKHGIRRLGGRTKMVNHVEACFPTPTVDYVPAWYGFDEEEAFRAHVEGVGFLPYEYFQAHGGSHEGDHAELYFTPTEMGWGRSIKLDHDFVGRAALEAEVAEPRRVMRTLVWNAEDVGDVLMSLFRKDADPYKVMEWPREYLGRVVADKVLAGGEPVGLATSRCYSYWFREMLSLCVIDVAHAEPGTAVEVVWGDPGTRQKHIRATVARAPYKTDNRRADVRSL